MYPLHRSLTRMPKLPAIRPRELVVKLKKLGFIEQHSALLREAHIERDKFLNA